MAISPLFFFNYLIKNGINFFCGVPDSLLKNFCLCIDENVKKEQHIITANEGNAIALAAGYYLGTGKIPLVYMQNSGLGNAINPLLSLCDSDVYSIPMIVLLGWRGEPGVKDEPQHVKQGLIHEEILSVIGASSSIISRKSTDIPEIINLGVKTALKKQSPFFLSVKKDTFEKYNNKVEIKNSNKMIRENALEIILKKIPDDAIVVSTTGKTSREIFEIRKKNTESHKKDFLTVGSMGHCSSIALGIAISSPKRKIICIDGDGALIMHMGSLATIGQLYPINFYHILINNYVHESVGGQRTSAKNINFCDLSKANGYNNILSVNNKPDLVSKFDSFLRKSGPNFLEVKVNHDSRNDLGRPTIKPVDNKKDFMFYIKNSINNSKK
jgi:phosphonopyruvate decarboxylase